ncbi:MMPL family transporter [Microbulbifer rhizosphaerae]|uniref:Putative exporter n=1 Tax=Microbulbifer rhizosphaerae TaxID=1562603 RepID=A0A7W4WEQ0_9GAMM|nr:hypothetical protein [Microbulbifer rhizosphaerae]MBB3062855.1 putative exporter [Microbulbifer rhizosphaerae]
MKRRLAIWFTLAAAFALAAALRYQPGWLQTDILALAGEGAGAPAVAAAQEKLNRKLQRSLLWMLVAPRGEAAALAGATETLAQKLAASAAIESVEYRWAQSERYQSEWTLLFPLRQQLLAPGDRALLRESPDQLVQRQLAAIYGPKSGGLDLQRDPFELFRHYFTAGPALSSELHGDIPVQRSGERQFTLIRATAGATELRGRIETPLLALREEMGLWAEAQGLELLAVGAPLHTEYAAAGAQREIRLIGGLSIAAICLLSLLVFRSARPLLLSIFAIGCGIASGTAAVLALLGQMHILAFVFGTTVTGLAIDYAFHFICNRLRGDPGRDGDILPGLLLGLLSSCLAFFALALTPFPLLRQMGLFVGFGLIGAWLTVVLLFPALLRLKPRPLVLAQHLALGKERWYGLCLSALLLLAALALPRLEFADDLELFYRPPEFLAGEEARLNRLLPSRAESSYFLVRGKNWQQLLQREWRLAESLREQQHAGELQYFEALSEKFPPPEVQRENWALMRSFYASATVEGFYTQLGYSETEAEQLIAELQRPFRALTLEEWLAVAGNNYRDLWLGCNGDGCASIVRLYGLDGALEEVPAIEGVTLVDPPREIAAVMSQQRDLLLQLLPLVLLIAFAVIALRTGPRRALAIIGLPLAALAGTMTALILSGSGISLFHVAALLLIFGIGVDYAVFSHMSDGGEKSYTLLAIAMAGVTTLLGFGLLALSGTPAIADFGLTLALGTSLTLLLAVLFFIGAEPGYSRSGNHMKTG